MASQSHRVNNLTVWLHGLAAAAVSAFASAASGALALPTVFTFDKTGLINMGKLAAVPAMLAVFAYLKNSPIPKLSNQGEPPCHLPGSPPDMPLRPY
jgi:hypothetical protein